MKILRLLIFFLSINAIWAQVSAGYPTETITVTPGTFTNIYFYGCHCHDLLVSYTGPGVVFCSQLGNFDINGNILPLATNGDMASLSFTVPGYYSFSTESYPSSGVGGCGSGTIVCAGAELDFNVIACSTPASPSVAATSSSVVLGTSTTLLATGCPGGTISWFTNSLGSGSPLSSTTVAPTATTTYYAFCTVGTCESAASSVTITVTPPVPPNPWNGSGPAGTPYVMQKMITNPDDWNIYDNPNLTGNPIGKYGNEQYLVALTGNIQGNAMEVSVPDPSTSRTGYVEVACGECVYRPIKGHIVVNSTGPLKVNKYSGDLTNPVSNQFMKLDPSCSGGATCLVKTYQGQRYAVIDSAQKGSAWFYEISLPSGLAEDLSGYVPKAQCTFVPPVVNYEPTSIPSLAAGGIEKDAISAEVYWQAAIADSVTLILHQGTQYKYSIKTHQSPIELTGLTPNTTYRINFIGHKNGYKSCLSEDIFLTTDPSQQPTTVTFSHEEIGGTPGITPGDLIEFTGSVEGEHANALLTWTWKVDGMPVGTGKIFTYTFTTGGNHTVECCFGSYCVSEVVNVGGPMPHARVQGLEFYADNVLEMAPGMYELSGSSVFVRRVGGQYDGVRFDLAPNEVCLVDSPSKFVSLPNAVAYVPYVKGIDRRIYEGKMTFSVSGYNLAYRFGGASFINKALEFAKLKVPTLTTTVLSDGAVMSAGRLQLPPIVKKWDQQSCDTFLVPTNIGNPNTVGTATIMPGTSYAQTVPIKDSTSCVAATKLKMSLSGLSMRRSGFWLAAQIKITDIKVATLRIRRLEVDMDYQPYEKFYGGADIDFGMFGIEANVLIREKRLDSIGLAINLPPSTAPIGTTGLSIYQIRGSVSNLQGADNLPLTLRAGITIGPFAPADMSSMLEIKGDIAYKVGTSFEFAGSLRLWILANAEVRAYVARHRFEFAARIELLQILEGRLKTVVYKPNVGKTRFYGVAGIQLKMPDPAGIQPGFLGWVLDRFFDKGDPIARIAAYACNDYVCGWAGVKFPWPVNWVRFSGMLRWNPSSTTMSSGFGLGLSKMTPEANAAIDSLFTGQKTMGLMDGTYTYHLDQSTEVLVIEAFTAKGSTPSINVHLADGTIITPANWSTFPDVAYQADPDSGICFYMLRYPKLGDYGFTVSDANTFDIFRLNAAPSFYFTNVNNYPSANALVAYWSDSDPDDDAKIRIFLDRDKENADGISLAEDLSEDDVVDMNYFTYGNQATGDYYLGATIQDTMGHHYTTYYDTPIRVITNAAPNAPTLQNITFDDKNIFGSFLKNNPEGRFYNLYYSTDPNGTVSYNSPSLGVVDTSLTFVLGLTIKPGRTYNFALTCMDTLYRESAMSNIVTVNYVANVENNEPYFLPNQNIKESVVAGQTYSYTLQAADADNEPLSYVLLEGPNGMVVNKTTGQVTWTPDLTSSGLAWIQVAVLDPSGAYDSLFYEIVVLGTYTKEADIQFNKNLFVNYGDQAIVTIRDLDVGISRINKDIITVRVTSESDMAVNLFPAVETAPNSREYAIYFTMGTTTGGGALRVMPGDKIWVEYYDNTVSANVRTQAYFTILAADFEMNLDSCGNVSSFNAIATGDNLSYVWDFGDRSTGTGRRPNHIFTHAGPFNVSLVVSDPDGRSITVNKTIDIDCIVLPNEITFKGAALAEGNMLSWEVSADDPTQTFYVERAADGEDFTQIAAVAHTQMRQNYLDKDLTQIHYTYRLRLVDVNGDVSYSNQVYLSRVVSAAVRCYPNPVASSLHIAMESVYESMLTIKIYDMKGSLVLETTGECVLGKNILEIPVNELQSGAYQVQVISENESIMTQFIKE